MVVKMSRSFPEYAENHYQNGIYVIRGGRGRDVVRTNNALDSVPVRHLKNR